MADRNFWQRWGDKFRDDKGLFQGGDFGRIGGRFQDFLDTTSALQPRTDQTPGGVMLSNLANPNQPGVDVVTPGGTYDPRATRGFADARSLATTFDPTNPNSVRELQLRLIDQGYLSGAQDAEGNYIEADSKYGPKTESALRDLQSHFDVNNPTNPNSLLGYTEYFSQPNQVPFLNNQPGVINPALSVNPAGPSIGPANNPSYNASGSSMSPGEIINQHAQVNSQVSPTTDTSTNPYSPVFEGMNAYNSSDTPYLDSLVGFGNTIGGFMSKLNPYNYMDSK